MGTIKNKIHHISISQISTNLGTGPFINSKYYPPSQKVHLIERVALNKVLKDIQNRKLTILQAPAGYGKSTLLTQWYTKLISDNHPVGWLSLDDDDNNTLTLLGYLLGIISSIGNLSDVEDITSGKTVGELSTRDLLVLLIHKIETFNKAVFICLDNFEVLDKEAVIEVIRPLLRFTPDHFQLIIASRSQPDLELSRMRTQGLLHQVTAIDLRFSLHEIEEFFQGKLSKQEEKVVAERTQCWPVAIQLARYWHERDGSSMLKKFSGVPEEISEYLSEQVLLQLPEQVQEILLEISLLEVLTEKDIRGIFIEKDYWSKLDDLASLKPFLYLHDTVPLSYHLNPIFRDYLRIEFNKRNPKKKQAIHHSAALWFAEDNQLSTAVRHAKESHDKELAGRLVQDAGGLSMWISKGLSHVTSVHRLLDEKVIESFPRLKLLRSLILLKEGKLIEARSLYEQVGKESFSFTIDKKNPDINALKLDALVVDSTLLVNECRLATAGYLSNYEDVVSNSATDNELFQGNLMTLLCLSYHQQGAFDKGLDYANRAIAVYGKSGKVHGQTFNYLHKGVIYFAQGNSRKTIQCYKQALSIARKYYGTDKSKIAITSPLIAEVNYELNNLDTVSSCLHNIIKKLHATEGWFDIYAAGYITSAQMILNDAGLDAAIEFLDSVESEIETCGITGLAKIILATRISLLSCNGLLNEAEYVLKYSNLTIDTYIKPSAIATTWREREAVIKAIAEFSLRRGVSQELFQELLHISQNLLATMHIRSFIHIGTITSLAGMTLGENEQTWKLLIQVLDKSRYSGFIRFFIDKGDQARQMLELFEKERGHVISRHTAQHCHDIIEQFDFPGEEKQNHFLTKRESELLVELKGGKSDKLIARTLRVSPNTVRYHLKKLYRKLGAVNRTEAVHIAREASLIE